MNLKILAVADYASIDEATQKLNILGVFTKIFAREFPVYHRRMVIVAKITADLGDSADEHKLAISLVDDDNTELIELNTPFNIPHASSGVRPDFNAVWEINQLEFPHEGYYEVKVKVDESELGTTSLELIHFK